MLWLVFRKDKFICHFRTAYKGCMNANTVIKSVMNDDVAHLKTGVK